jgi:hypothetical protein
MCQYPNHASAAITTTPTMMPTVITALRVLLVKAMFACIGAVPATLPRPELITKSRLACATDQVLELVFPGKCKPLLYYQSSASPRRQSSMPLPTSLNPPARITWEAKLVQSPPPSPKLS